MRFTSIAWSQRGIYFSKFLVAELGFCFSFMLIRKKKDVFCFFSNENKTCSLLQHQHHHVRYAWCSGTKFWHEGLLMKMSDVKLSQVPHLWWHMPLSVAQGKTPWSCSSPGSFSSQGPWMDPGFGQRKALGFVSSPLLHKTWVLLAPSWPAPKKEAPHAFPQHEGESVPLKSHWWAALACFSSLKTRIWTCYCYWNKLWKAYDDCKQ